MGTWDAGGFGNDTALDFVQSLESIQAIAGCIRAKRTAQMDAGEASEVIAAGELVAAMMGRPAPDMPEDALSRFGAPEPPDQSLMADARRAVERVRDGSELAELWAEDDAGDWAEAVAELLCRLDPSHEYTPLDRSQDVPGEVLGHCFVCERSIATQDGVDLVYEVDEVGVYSTMTLYAHRHCVEREFEPPHWNDDGTPSEGVLRQFGQHLGFGPEG